MRPSSGKACSRTRGVPAPLVAAGGMGSAGSGSTSGAASASGDDGVGSGSSAVGVDIGGSLAGSGADAPVGGEGWGLEAEGIQEPDQQAGCEPPDQRPVDPEHGAGEVAGDAAGRHRLLAQDGAERQGPVVGGVGQLA